MIEFFTSSLGKYLIAGVLAVALIGGIYLKGRSDGEAAVNAEVAAANLALQKKADALSNELVIQQAIAMSVTAKKADTYVQQIHAAPASDRRRVAAHGVRDIVLGASP